MTDTIAGIPPELAALLKSNFKCLSMVISEFSPVMSYGAGPGSLSVGFHPELNT
ncbi:MAG: hypothetical protein PHR56_04225 [Dehalococcoidales bacterium]|nr:hypothetical protein [Dehalococcoidales bacterium]